MNEISLLIKTDKRFFKRFPAHFARFPALLKNWGNPLRVLPLFEVFRLYLKNWDNPLRVLPLFARFSALLKNLDNPLRVLPLFETMPVRLLSAIRQTKPASYQTVFRL